MKEQGFSPKRQLGQNFLVDPNILRIILKEAFPLRGKRVLEVGPGTGILTTALLKEGAKVTAVEMDKALASHLKEGLLPNPNLRLITGDILKLELETLFEEERIEKVVSNLPYKITSPLLFKLFLLRRLPEALVLMVQLETGQRITARFGEKGYSPLGILLQSCYQAELVHKVSPEAFRPRPKVRSAIVRLELKKEQLSHPLRTAMRRVVSWGFSHPRKKVLKSLSLAQPEVEWKSLLSTAGVEPANRPHEVSPQQWLALSSAFLENYGD